MKILVACEYSGRVRDAFAAKGHWAVSCDLLPTERPGPHVQGDVLALLDEHEWDLLIAFPPCTHLSGSGARWWPQKRADGRQQAAVEFVRRLHDAPIDRIAIENPVGILSTAIRKPNQIIQPWQFGHDASKRTCLWLKGLPQLEPTKLVEGRLVNGRKRWGNQTDSGQNKLGPSPDRAKVRSLTYQGIADAMAEQWG
ncbi:MAG: DNA cytosine methyltransferase [Actinomycetales bacterium]|nr:DNA cytosine methyltransferase [Actinomycetales bacterium]